MKCPNISHPDWKRLVDKIGEINAWTEYVKNDTIPNADNYDFIPESNRELKDTVDFNSRLLKDNYSPREIEEIINTASSVVLNFIKENKKRIYYVNDQGEESDEPKEGFQKKVSVNTFNTAFNFFKEELHNIIADTQLEKFKKLERFLSEIRTEVKNKLQKLDLISKKKLEGINFLDNDNSKPLEENELELIDENPDANLNYYQDDYAFRFDSKSNALKEVKRFLAFIPKTEYDKANNQYVEVGSFLSTPEMHVPSFLSYDETYETLKGLLANLPPIWSIMRTVLEDNQQNRPWIYNLLLQLDNYDGDKNQLINQFVTTMSSAYADYNTTLIKEKITPDNDIVYYFNNISTDQSSVISNIVDRWKENFKRSKLIEVTNEGFVINKNEVNKIIEKINSLSTLTSKDLNAINKIRSAFEDIGINLTDQTIDLLLNTNVINGLKYEKQFIEKSGIFKLIVDRLNGYDNEGIETEYQFDVINPLINNSGVKLLAKKESQFSNFAFSNTTRNGKNNIVYNYSFNKHLTIQYRKLLEDKNYREKLLKLPFTSVLLDLNNNPIYKTWLWHFQNNSDFKNIFSIDPYDTFKLSYQDGSNLSELQEQELEVLQLTSIQNNFLHKNKERIIKYLFTVPSKTTSYMVTSIGINVNPIFLEGDKFDLDKTTINSLYSIVYSEYNRILAQQDKEFQNSAYNIGSKKFLFNPIFNKEFSPELYTDTGKLKLFTTKINNNLTVEQYIKAKIKNFINESVKETIENWKRLGIISNNKIKISDFNFIKKHSSLSDSELIKYTAIDYIVNSQLAKYNMHQSFIGDPALYWKSNIEEAWDNINKRLAGIIAPRKDLALKNEDEQFISLKLADREGNLALNFAELNYKLGNEIAKPYTDLNGTDAQEYTTLKEHLDVLYKQGMLKTEVYNNILTKIKKEGNNLILTKEELGTVLQPVKPVFFSMLIDEDNNFAPIEYIKSSSIPLLPQFTQGLEIDKLRVKMEELENQKGLNVRATFKSATKVGGKKYLNIFDNEGNIKDFEIKEEHYTTLPRIGFGIQQEVPFDENKESVIKGTQVLKLLFDSAKDLSDFNLNGKNLDGKSLFNKWTKLHDDLYSKSLEIVHNKILNDKGNIDYLKLQKILKEEAVNRGFSEVEISYLELNESNTGFKYPLWSSPISNKLEALLTSIYTNNVLKQKVHGKSYVLVSEEGIKGKSKGIIYTKKYNQQLQPSSTVKDENGNEKLTKNQVLIPWNFRDKNGNKLDIKKFINEDGYIDSTKISPYLLEQFGYRIPTQGHNSMALLEVVGFLPEEMGDVVIATRNFITQMGSDFDVDKLIIHDYYTQVSKQGKLKKIKDKIKFGTDESLHKQNINTQIKIIKNKLLDIQKSVLSHPEIHKKSISPLTTGTLKDTVKIVRKSKVVSNDFIGPNYAKNKYLQSVSGKDMTGIMALANTFNSITQNLNINLNNEEIIIGDNLGNPIKLNSLSNPYRINLDNGKLSKDSKVLTSSYLLSAAVDNEKDPILGDLNINLITSPVVNMLSILGVPEDYIGLFTSQPIIKEFVQKVQSEQGLFGNYPGSSTSLKESVFQELSEKLLKDLGKLNIEKYNEEFPLTLEHLKFTFNNNSNSKLPKVFSEQDSKVEKINTLIQYLTLLKFRKLNLYGESIDRVKGSLNIESKGLGKSFLEVSDKIDKIQRNIYSSGLFLGLEKLLLQDNNNYTLSGSAFINSFIDADKNFNIPDVLPYESNSFKLAQEQLKYLLNKDSLSVDELYNLWTNLKSYIFSNHYSYSRKSLFFDTKTNKSLATRVSDLLTKDKKYASNPFLTRLSWQLNSGNKPSLLFYNAAKETNIEEQNIQNGFDALFEDKNEEVVIIGFDLINYFLANGGIQKAKEWSRFIRPRYLNYATSNIEFNDVNSIGNIAYPISKFIIQYAQHNPYMIKEAQAQAKNNQVILSYINDPQVNLISSDGKNYVPIIKIKDNKSRKKYSLYLLNRKKSNSKNAVFDKIDVLGDKFYTEYNSNELLNKSLIGKITPETKIEENNFTTNFVDKKEPNGTEPKLIVNNTKINNYKEFYGNSLKEALNIIISEKDQKHSIVAKFILDVAQSLNDVSIEFESDKNKLYSAKYFENKIVVNLANHNNSNSVNNDILHEALHVIFDKAVNTGMLTPEQQVSYNNLKTIFERLLNGDNNIFNKDILSKYKNLLEKSKLEELSVEEQNFLVQNRDLYYPLTDFEEFIVGLFTNDKFQKALNDIEYDQNQSLLNRILDILAKIFNDFVKYFNIKNNSLLHESIKNSLNLLHTVKNIETNHTEKHSLKASKIQQEYTEKTNKLLNDLKARLVNAYRAERIVDDPKSKIRLEDRIKTIQEDIDKLTKTNDLDYIIDIANNDLEYIDSIKDNVIISPEELNYAISTLATWKDIVNPEYNLVNKAEIGSERYNKLADIRDKANRLDDYIDNIKINTAISASKEVGVNLSEKDLRIHNEINALSASTMDLSRVGDIALGAVDKMVRSGIVIAKKESGEIQNKIDSSIEKASKSEIFKKEGYYTYAEHDKDGHLTGRVVGPLIPEYYDERQKLLNNALDAPNPTFAKSEWNKYFNWIKENHIIIDIRQLYEENNEGLLIWKPNDQYLKELKNQLDENNSNSEEVINKQKEKIDQYNSDLESRINEYKEDLEGNKKLEEWKSANSPFIHIRNLLDGYVSQKINGKNILNKGYKYTVRRAISKWENNQYKIIKNDENLNQFYTLFTDTLKQLYSYIPSYLKEELTYRDIPNLSKDLREIFTEKGMSHALSSIGDKAIESITIKNFDPYTLVDPVTKQTQKQLEVGFLNKINPENKSYDLGKVLKAFATEAIMYKHKSRVEDSLRLMSNIINNSLEQSINSDGTIKRSKAGELTLTKGLNNLKTQLNYYLDAFYGQRKDTKQWSTRWSKVLGKQLLTESEKKKIEEEKLNIQSLNISEEDKQQRLKDLEENAPRYFSWGKLADTALQYLQLKGMGWNVFGSMTNLTFGWVANYNYAVGNRDFGLNEFWRANSIMLNSSKRDFHYNSIARKIYSLMNKYDTLKEIIEAAYKSTTSTNVFASGIKKLSPFELQRRGEYFVQGQTMVALMLATKVNVIIDGKEQSISLWDAYDEYGSWKYGVNNDWEGDNYNKKHNKEFINFKVKLDQIVKSIHGNYDPNSPVLIKKGVLGRALLQFRSWVAEGFASRFENEKYDVLLQRKRKGRYQTFLDLGFGNSIRTMLNQIAKGDRAFDHLVDSKGNLLEGEALDITRENMRRNLNELYQKTIILGLALFLKHLDIDDDDDEAKMASNFMLNQLYRLSDDIEFYYSPSAFENISRSALPIMTLIIDGGKLTDSISDYVMGEDDIIKTGKYKGQSKIFRRAIKVFPFTSSVGSLYNKTQSVEEFRN